MNITMVKDAYKLYRHEIYVKNQWEDRAGVLLMIFTSLYSNLIKLFIILK